MQEMRLQSLGQKDILENEMATHSSILAWKSHGHRSLADYRSWVRKRFACDLTTWQYVYVCILEYVYMHIYVYVYTYSIHICVCILDYIYILYIHICCSVAQWLNNDNLKNGHNSTILKLLRTINWNKLNCHSITYRWSENCSVSDYLQSHGYTVHGILKARILKWIAVTFSRLTSQPRGQTQVSHTGGRFFAIWATKGIQKFLNTGCVCVLSRSVMSESFATHGP